MTFSSRDRLYSKITESRLVDAERVDSGLDASRQWSTRTPGSGLRTTFHIDSIVRCNWRSNATELPSTPQVCAARDTKELQVGSSATLPFRHG